MIRFKKIAICKHDHNGENMYTYAGIFMRIVDTPTVLVFSKEENK